MQRLSAADLIREIAKLDPTRVYEYASGRSKLRILEIIKPEGPIRFMSWESRKTEADARESSISTERLETAALAFSSRPNYPIHFDRLFSAGGNSRSAFETLLAHTPHFFICRPQRVNPYTGDNEERRLKHIMWCPDEEHPWGETMEKEYNQVISELELGVDFGTIADTSLLPGEEFDSIEAKRTHSQIQVALVEIGRALGLRTWIAAGDRSIDVKNTKLGKLEGVIQSLDEVRIFFDNDIKQAARLIDCIWVTANGKIIPAVIEVEHTTGVTSGLTRMLKFKETLGSIQTTFTIVAPDKFRSKVILEANQKAFRKLNARFMPYSTVRTLYGLIQKFSLSKYVDYSFMYPFMETIVEDWQ